MNYEFCVQDPTSADTVYLFEALITAAQLATYWRGVFAFASRNGVSLLLEDSATQAFLGRGGKFELVVGIDAVTNRQTLEYLAQVETEQPGVNVRVFWNETRSLFHPKLSHFRSDDGQETLIVGSGNLTPGGLQQNFEAYTVLRNETPDEHLSVVSLDRFLERHAQDVRPIDEEILERASRNIIVRGGGRRGTRRTVDVTPEVIEAAAEALIEQQEAATPLSVDGVLIAQVPKAGGRWHQVHFNAAVIEQFFEVEPNSNQRVYLLERKSDGTAGEEEVRPCILSHTNKNMKIELGARRNAEYPDNGVPIAVFRRIQARSFEYMLIFPGEEGYDELLQMTNTLPKIGNGLRRVITDSAVLSVNWPTSPLSD